MEQFNTLSTGVEGIRKAFAYIKANLDDITIPGVKRIDINKIKKIIDSHSNGTQEQLSDYKLKLIRFIIVIDILKEQKYELDCFSSSVLNKISDLEDFLEWLSRIETGKINEALNTPLSELSKNNKQHLL